MGMWTSTRKDFDPQPCALCGGIKVEGQWWQLNNYHEVSGYFCPGCFEKVSHDPYGKPHHPAEYKAVKVALEIIRAA